MHKADWVINAENLRRSIGGLAAADLVIFGVQRKEDCCLQWNGARMRATVRTHTAAQFPRWEGAGRAEDGFAACL
jgi:hypothetical protein